MDQEFEKAKHLTETSGRILLTMHERMDGDDGGSVLALAHRLRQMGKTVECAIKKGVPPSLEFLPGSELVQDDIAHTNFDLLIMCGCSEKKRCGSENILSLKIPTINIDHHMDNKLFAEVNLVDPKASSVAELVYDFFIWNNWNITKDIATCLLTGIITDTGGFKHSNTQSSTLKAAAQLLYKGASLNTIFKNTFKNKSPKTLQAWGNAFKNVYFDSESKIIYSVITEEELQNLGPALPQNAFEGFVETLNSVPEAKFAMFLKQEGEIVKGSLRSETFKGVNVARIAQVFGGGGHKLAAGFSIAGKLMKDEAGKWRVV